MADNFKKDMHLVVQLTLMLLLQQPKPQMERRELDYQLLGLIY